MNFVRGHWKECPCQRDTGLNWLAYRRRGNTQKHVCKAVLSSLFHTGEGRGRQGGQKMEETMSQAESELKLSL